MLAAVKKHCFNAPLSDSRKQMVKTMMILLLIGVFINFTLFKVCPVLNHPDIPEINAERDLYIKTIMAYQPLGLCKCLFLISVLI